MGKEMTMTSMGEGMTMTLLAMEYLDLGKDLDKDS